MQIPVFHSVKTVGDRDIQPLGVNHMCLGVSNAMDLTRPSIIGREHGAAKKTLTLICQGLSQRKASFVLILSNVSTAKATIKWTCPYWRNHFNKIWHGEKQQELQGIRVQ